MSLALFAALALPWIAAASPAESPAGPEGADDATAAASMTTTVVGERRAARCVAALVVEEDSLYPAPDALFRAFTLPQLAVRYDRFESVAVDVDQVWAAPPAGVLAALERMRRAHCVVDLFLLRRDGPKPVEWLERLAPEKRPHLRLVYDSGYTFTSDDQRWLDVGAHAFVHHSRWCPFLFYAALLSAWHEGVPLRDAVKHARVTTKELLTAGRNTVSAEQFDVQIVGDARMLSGAGS